MKLLYRLKNIDLSTNEKIIADYILKHPWDVLEMTSKELSDACFVSTATIYRLCQKLDIAGLNELKIKLIAELNSKSEEEFNFDFPVKEYQTHYEVINLLKEDYIKTLDSTNTFFDIEELRRISTALKRANRIDVYTSAGNIYFAKNFQFQMKEIGVNVGVPVDEYEQRLYASSSDENTLAIMISFGGRGMMFDILLEILKIKKAKVLCLSSPDFKVDCDYHLYISPYENHYNKISSYSTRLSILYILDVLYTLYFELDYKNNLNKKLDYYHIIDITNPKKK